MEKLFSNWANWIEITKMYSQTYEVGQKVKGEIGEVISGYAIVQLTELGGVGFLKLPKGKKYEEDMPVECYVIDNTDYLELAFEKDATPRKEKEKLIEVSGKVFINNGKVIVVELVENIFGYYFSDDKSLKAWEEVKCFIPEIYSELRFKNSIGKIPIKKIEKF